MARIRPITLTSSPGPSRCHVTHKAPAMVFSAGGYTGNFFHDFNDGFIPLFVTIHTILPSSDRDFVLVVDSAKEWWLRKYADLLRALSKRPVVTLGNNNGSSLHCFESASVGLVSHGFMTIEPNRFPHGPVSLLSFRALLDRAYSPKAQSNQPNLGSISRGAFYMRRPRLVLASRSGDVGRVMLNQDRVKVLTGGRIRRAVFIQVVPVGAGWVAEACFGKAAREMGLEYMENKIRAEESSLVEKYGKDDPLMKGGGSGEVEGWKHEVMGIYLKEQSVRLDLKRFKGYLKKAYRKAKRFMANSG
ncbi:hypothetical protein Droror1_Dr00018816 [Drosera rotundifolia]